MDSNLHSPSDSTGAKTAFHKSSNDHSNRKYRRRSPVSGSSSSDGDPIREHSSPPSHSMDDNAIQNDNRHRKDDRGEIDRDHKRSRYSRDDGGSNRKADRRSYNDRRHDDYRRHEKYAHEDHRNFHKLSPRTKSGSGGHSSYNDHARREFEQNRSRDNVDKHLRDRSDGLGHKSRDKDRGHRSEHHYKDTSRRESKELDDPKYTRVEKGKSHDQETRGLKDSHFKEPGEVLDDKIVLPAKKSKFSSNKDTEYKDANEVQSSSSKQGQDLVDKASSGQEFVKESDIDAAKIAAMKAAELVNRNLIGTGFMSTDQKKKLLWGSKKSTPTEEVTHRWDTSMFSDRERQEKFNKLMGVKGDVKANQKPEIQDGSLAEKQKELQIDLEKQYTAGLRRRDGRTVGLGL